MGYTEYVYTIVKNECEYMDTVYGDYIEYLVGIFGLRALSKDRLLESCGVINGRRLYVIVEKQTN